MKELKRTQEFWADVAAAKASNKDLAAKYHVSPSHVSKARIMLQKVPYQSKVADGKVLCAKCEKADTLVVYRDLALVCQDCYSQLARGVITFPARPAASDKDLTAAIDKVVTYFNKCLDQPKWGEKFQDFAGDENAGSAIGVLEKFLAEASR